MAKDWIDFDVIRKSVSMAMILDHYGIDWLRGSREGLQGRCPIHLGEGQRSFHASFAKEVFHCFSCGAKGTVLDFVAAMESCGVREAALKLTEWFAIADGSCGLPSKTPRSRTPRLQRCPHPCASWLEG